MQHCLRHACRRGNHMLAIIEHEHQLLGTKRIGDMFG